MHYRKKTERNEAKEKEKLVKAQKFHASLTKFLEQKKSGNKDFNLLNNIADLLRIGPDFGTLWNYRKEILIDFKQTLLDKENNDNDGDNDDMSKEFDKLCQNELAFTEECLKLNLKSYNIWHHRMWLLQFINNPDIKQELFLCEKCLLIDERNFHCWNHRRFVAKFGNIPVLEEFKFTSKKIEENFSNFSSWHYRSCLYKQLLKDNFDLTELKSMIDKDFILIKNAIFTDPNDQSPWFYFKWLLKFENSLITAEESKTNVTRFILIHETEDRHLFAIEFSEPMTKLDLQLKIDNNLVEFENWNSILNGSIWLAIVKAKIKSNDLDQHDFLLTIQNQVIYQQFSYQNQLDEQIICYVYTSNCYEICDEKLKNISNRIEDLKILLDIEADSKWPNYMLAVLDSINDSKNKINCLIQKDSLRANYYNDLRSRLSLKKKLSLENIIKIANLCFSLANCNLHSLYYISNLMHLQFLNLTGNFLIKIGQSFSPLINLRCLILDKNEIYLCDKNLHLDNLFILSLKNNKIDNISELESLCNISKNLQHINFIGNPLNLTEIMLTGNLSKENIHIYFNVNDELKFNIVLDTELKSIVKRKAIWPNNIVNN